MHAPSILKIKPGCFIMVLFLLTAGDSLYSQFITDPKKAGEEIFLARTKQFGEFTDRFNFKTDFKGNPVDSAFKAKMPREKMVSTLFDLRDPRIESGNTSYSEEYLNIKASFIMDVNRKNLFLNRYSESIIAEARARVIYKGAPHAISLFLNQETEGNGKVRWVLLTARGDILDIFKKDTSMVRFIPPASNETDFINLKRALEDTDHLQDYASHDFQPDYLTLFFYCLRSGTIRYEYVEKVIYHIIDIPGWYIKVEEFNRNELNSGWLISDVKKNNIRLPDFIRSLQ